MITRNDVMEQWKRITSGRMYPILTRQPRRISMGEHILNRMTHSLTVMVCSHCQDARTLTNRGYVELRRFHGEAKCDGCQEHGSIAMWLYEDSPWHQDIRLDDKLNAIRRRDRQQRERERFRIRA